MSFSNISNYAQIKSNRKISTGFEALFTIALSFYSFVARCKISHLRQTLDSLKQFINAVIL